MEKLCPVCNGLTKIKELCPACGRPLRDGGALEDYWGPYSPYMDGDLLARGLPDTQCVHLLYCPECHYDTRAAWALIAV